MLRKPIRIFGIVPNHVLEPQSWFFFCSLPTQKLLNHGFPSTCKLQTYHLAGVFHQGPAALVILTNEASICCELIQETRAFLKNARLAWRLTNQQMGWDGMGVSPEAIMESCTFFGFFWGCLPQFLLPNLSSWWFQPIWKILVKLDHFPT